MAPSVPAGSPPGSQEGSLGPSGTPVTPPVAPRRPAVLETHGDRRVDDWLWLRDRDDPEVLALLRSENAYTAAATAHLAGFHEHLFAEIRGRIVETDLTVAVRKDDWWYYTRTVEGRDYAIHCRLPVHGEGRDPDTPPGTETTDTGADLAPWPDEQVLLDENTLAGDHPYLDVANLSVSPGHGRLAYAVDTTGDERFTLRIRDLATGTDLPGEIEGTSYGVAWANDNETIFFTRPDAANRTYQLWRHTLGSPEAEDLLVHEETDERFHLGVDRTKDGAFIVLELHSKITAEVHTIDADKPRSSPQIVEPRRQGVEYQVLVVAHIQPNEKDLGAIAALRVHGSARRVAHPEAHGDRRSAGALQGNLRLGILQTELAERATALGHDFDVRQRGQVGDQRVDQVCRYRAGGGLGHFPAVTGTPAARMRFNRPSRSSTRSATAGAPGSGTRR